MSESGPGQEYLSGLEKCKVVVDGKEYELTLESAPGDEEILYVFVEALPGCNSFGNNEEEALVNIASVIRNYTAIAD